MELESDEDVDGGDEDMDEVDVEDEAPELVSADTVKEDLEEEEEGEDDDEDDDDEEGGGSEEEEEFEEEGSDFEDQEEIEENTVDPEQPVMKKQKLSLATQKVPVFFASPTTLI